MSKKNEDSIERFFKKAVAQQDTTFRESDWRNMEKMLDEQAHERAAIRAKNIRRGIYSLVVLSLISLSVYFLTFNNTVTPSDSAKKEQPLSKQKQAAAGAEAPMNEAKEEVPTASLLSSSEKTAKEVPPSGEIGTSKETSSLKEPIASKDAPVVSGTSVLKESVASENAPLSTRTSVLKESIVSKDVPVLKETSEAKESIAAKDGLLSKETPALKGSVALKDAPVLKETAVSKESIAPKDSPLSKETSALKESLALKDVPVLKETSESKESIASKDAPVSERTIASKDITRREGTTIPQLSTGKADGVSDRPLNDVKKSAEKNQGSGLKDVVVAGENSDLKNAQQSILSKSASENKEEIDLLTVKPDQGTTLSDQKKPALDKKDQDGKNIAGIGEENAIAGEKQIPLPGESDPSEKIVHPSVVADADVIAQNKDTGGKVATSGDGAEKTINTTESLVPENKKIKEESDIEEKTPDKPEEKQQIPSRWSVALALAPDFSSTGLSRYTSPGEAFGLIVGYRLFNRLSITTGLLKSSKKYEGYGKDYQPPEGYWQRRTNGIIPDEIDGSCKVLEIPVMLQYSAMQKERSRIYVAAGVSSYIMQSQRYEYSFDEPNPGAANEWSTSDSFTYPFNIGHFSAGYERLLSPRLGVGIEPYLKVPFSGMGWSNVDLFSTGIFINVRYLILRKNPTTVDR